MAIGIAGGDGGRDVDAAQARESRVTALAKRLALSGSRYSGSGVTLKVTKAGATTLKHAKRAVTACEQT